MRKKIIIFGATGNVGSYLFKYATEFFDSNEFEVIASGRRETDFFTKRGYEYYSVDVTEPEDFDKASHRECLCCYGFGSRDTLIHVEL